MNSPRISVLVPICNVEDYLEECLESIAQQTMQDIEVICINDGSKDGSLDIIKKYVDKYPNFKLLDKENSGYGDSMNKGIDIATGEYIGIVESDDFIDKHMFEELYALADNGKIDVVKSNFTNFYEQDNGSRHFADADDRIMIPTSKKPFTIYEEPQLLFGHPSIWSAIYRRDFINKHNIRFMPEPGGGWTDNPFFFETCILADSIQWTQKAYYKYRKTNPNSSSNRQPDLTLAVRRMVDNLEVLEKYNINDEQILVMAYARALMYINGLRTEKYYMNQKDEIYKYARIMLQKINPEVLYRNFERHDIAFYFQYLNELGVKNTNKEKVLIYNWVPFANSAGWGGGVNIYCENLVKAILKNSPNVDVYFISSGFAYDSSRTDCYIQSIDNIYGDRCKSFEIVNSPVPAAQDCIINTPSIALKNDRLKKIVSDFIEQNGPFKTIHLNNIEGLSLDCLDLKQDFPNTKFIYSMHNYVPICLHGFYYDRNNNCVCSANHTANDCLACAKTSGRTNVLDDLYNRALLRAEDNSGKSIDKAEWAEKMGFSGLDKLNANEDFDLYSKTAIDALNRNMDLVLAVSERVKKIAVENGFDSGKTFTSYIGTKVAEFQHRKKIYKQDDNIFKIVYLGANYNLIEKGYQFLMDALEQIDQANASKIDLVLTTTNGNENQMRERLKKFHSVNIIHGYKHEELRKILLDCDLGVIPVLWEDNLPQIAIEMAANGVPVLASDLGGASELCSSELFKFQGGNVQDFIDKLLHLVNHPEDLEQYWENHGKLVTLDEHWQEMKKYYEVTEMGSVTFTADEYRKLLEQNDYLLKFANDVVVIDKRSKIRRLFSRIKNYCKKFIYYCRIEGFMWTAKAAKKKVCKKLRK